MADGKAGRRPRSTIDPKIMDRREQLSVFLVEWKLLELDVTAAERLTSTTTQRTPSSASSCGRATSPSSKPSWPAACDARPAVPCRLSTRCQPKPPL